MRIIFIKISKPNRHTVIVYEFDVPKLCNQSRTKRKMEMIKGKKNSRKRVSIALERMRYTYTPIRHTDST